jgi:hypothetical protein
VFIATPAVAQVPPTVSVSPLFGPAGSSITISWSGFSTLRRCPNGIVSITWDNSPMGTAGQAPAGSFSTSVPADAKVTSHGIYVADTCGANSKASFRVTPSPVTTTQPPPPVITDPPVVITTKPPVVTTTTTPPTTTTTETTTTTTETTSSTTSPGTSSGGDGALTLDKDNIQPGDPLTATGTGCKPDSDVKLSSLNEDVGRARADSTGRFSTGVEFSMIQPGRHVIRAECGIVLVGSVDVALTTSSSGGTTSTLVVLVFFLLIGATMLRRQFSALRAPKAVS